MDIAQLDSAVHHYCGLGIATSTARTYRAAVSRFAKFCEKFNVSRPFPVSVLLLCRFVNCGDGKGGAHCHIEDLPGRNPTRPDNQGPSRTGLCLIATPSAPTVWRGSRAGLPAWWTDETASTHYPTVAGRDPPGVGSRGVSEHDKAMFSAAASLCFYGFFRAGEITIPSTTAFDARVHLAWGDVAVDDATPPSSIRVHLKRSKCDQLGKGVDVFVGKSGDRSCPVAATLLYVRIRGPAVGPFFVREDGVPLTKAAFVGKVRGALTINTGRGFE